MTLAEINAINAAWRRIGRQPNKDQAAREE